MRKLFHPASVLLYFLAFFVFFFIGAYYAILSGASSGQGLAAAGIVVGTGILSAFAAFFAAMIAVSYIETANIRRLNWIMALILVVFIVVTTVRAIQRKNRKADDSAPEAKPVPTVPARSQSRRDLHALPDHKMVGHGLLFARFSQHRPLLFYSNPNRINGQQPSVVDSVVFSGEVSGPEIVSAPPWLVPERLVADYQLMLFVVVSVKSNYLEVIVNAKTQKTLFVDRTAGRFVYWPDFLLGVVALQPIDRAQNPVRLKPLYNSSVVMTEYDHLKALLVRDEWVYVALRDVHRSALDHGWIRWRSDGLLLVRYDLLS